MSGTLLLELAATFIFQQCGNGRRLATSFAFGVRQSGLEGRKERELNLLRAYCCFFSFILFFGAVFMPF